VITERLIQHSYATFDIDHRNEWFYLNWIGEKNEIDINEICAQILPEIRKYGFTKVLNDNRSVTGIWNPELKYITDEWFRDIRQAGIRHFAWISNENFIHRVILESFIRSLQGAPAIRVFDTAEEAEAWLRQM
jgi:predicted glycosyl hydrolase (DUF1957 family)